MAEMMAKLSRRPSSPSSPSLRTPELATRFSYPRPLEAGQCANEAAPMAEGSGRRLRSAMQKAAQLGALAVGTSGRVGVSA